MRSAAVAVTPMSAKRPFATAEPSCRLMICASTSAGAVRVRVVVSMDPLCCHVLMQFNHYGGAAALLAADLVNLGPAPTPDQVGAALRRHRVVDPHVTARQATDLAGWGGELARCFGDATVEQRCADVNELLARAASKPYVSVHDGHPHLHYRAMSDDVVSRVRAVTVTGLAYLVCFAGGHRLGRCARTGCGTAFVDTSRAGRRRYCSVRCANTSAVSRHRASRRVTR